MPRNSPLNVLLVEDDDVDVMTVQRGFRARAVPHTLTLARDGREALAVLRGQTTGAPLPSPYVILLDLNLPGMNGIEFLRELRQDRDHAGAIVFVLTTSDAESDRTAAYAQHVAGYVLKSRVGRDFGAMLDLLDAYARTVSFP